ncbi:MAG: ribose 5-phosphate isomerase B [Cyclobacteriaceae bacterium]
MKLIIGNDHAGYDQKEAVKSFLIEKGYEVIDAGAYSAESVDYPDFAHAVSQGVISGKAELGILLCGTGNGVCMTANKHQDIRAGLCWSSEIAQLIRQHNNANVICIPARFISEKESLACVEAFVTTDFEGGRHQRRIDKMGCM